MKRISICDVTVRNYGQYVEEKFSFRLKLEIARMLDRLGVSVIELGPLSDNQSDYLLVKSMVSAVKGAALSVAVDFMDSTNPARCMEALKEAAHPRLQVKVPVSTVQMEYLCHKKPAVILELISSSVAACKAICPEVEFVAQDFSRAEETFLRSAVEAASKAGANVICLDDEAGQLLPEEFAAAVKAVKDTLPEGVRLGVRCDNSLFLANSCATYAVRAGVDEVKTSAYGLHSTSLLEFPAILSARRDYFGAECDVDETCLKHTVERIRQIYEESRSHSGSFVPASGEENVGFDASETRESVLKAVAAMGYDLGEEDADKVYESFRALASVNGSVSSKELDAIVASVAFQVPPTYVLESYLINSGNIITASCHLRLKKGEEVLEAVCIGDGPVDAAFLAIEKVLGRHFELDDFQIKSISEGREAMGGAVVKLRDKGKVFSGRGVSTDIIGSSIMAYLSAVNKIAYEEVQD